ncbi:hypothetical protein F4781DRAFT_218566 [Annulohypoxylon bovei var. microspora]|nr:hypothetical protein F4781DRAFT_218566 [Annulohypoxylon bovei var. microspora]
MPTFHLFPYLPIELRREIYILATPPRIVQVRESLVLDDPEDFAESYSMYDPSRSTENPPYTADDFKFDYAFEKFSERYEKELIRTKLHPDLAYFAFNWGGRVPGLAPPLTQMSLDSYGFTRQKARYQPWIPTSKTPEIPLHWLDHHLDAAFELIRESHLYSEAQIPPLLHTCSESRKLLMDYGYQIAFSTRTRGPRTWFHFGRDRLYIAKRQSENTVLMESEDTDLLTKCRCDVLGQFSPNDLKQIRSLVFSESVPHFRCPSAVLSGLVPLMPSLDEIFFEEWNPACLGRWVNGTDKEGQPSSQKCKDNRDGREPWRCIPVEEVDALVEEFCFYNQEAPYILGLPCFEPVYCKLFHLNIHRDSELKHISFFEHIARMLEEEAEELFNKYWPDLDFNIPRVKFVHTCPETTARQIIHGRHAFWRHYVELKKACAKGRPLIPPDYPKLPPPFRIFWPDWQGDEYWDAFYQTQEMTSFQLNRIGRYTSPSGAHLRGWYLGKGSVLEPSLEII